MRNIIGFGFALLVAVPSAWASGTSTTASKVFAAVSPSIVVVEAFDAKGHAIAQGSGVVIAKGVVVSNCHVFEEDGTDSASVFYRGKRLPAKLRYGDLQRDLCSFTVKGLSALPVRMRTASTLQVGENAYAIGAPEGFNLTLSSGLVSGLRKQADGTVIQTTASISPGSSGGGLFDSAGRLIGITSYYWSKGQQLNFALPVGWVKALPRHGKTPKELVKQQNEARATLKDGIKAFANGDYGTAIALLRPLGKQGYAAAQNKLGTMYEHGQGVPLSNSIAFYWYQRAAAQGFAPAQRNLGMMYFSGIGVSQDYAEAAHWLYKASQKGDPAAQLVLAVLYKAGLGVPLNYVDATKWLFIARATGDENVSKAADGMLEIISYKMSVPQIYSARRLARNWLTSHRH